MPTTAVRFRIPSHCKWCGAAGTVKPETTISGGSVFLTWCCRGCSREWPITRGETQMVERRTGEPDTRPLPRLERRA